MKKKAVGRKKILIIFVLLVLLVATYFTFFFSYTCKDLACFQAHQEKCAKTKFIKDNEEMTWEYNIIGKSNTQCEIEVKIEKIKKGALDKKILEGKSMTCYLPLGDIDSPEEKISLCHGLLKEELQGLMIQKLHEYVVENIGEISEELKKVI